MFPASEPVCSLCGGTGWQPARDADNRYRRCECVRDRIAALRLTAIPERFR
jgi:hypothetical protein